jgi:hypothetical protein
MQKDKQADKTNGTDLRKLYDNNETARRVFDHFARRTYNATETKTDRLLALLNSNGQIVSRGELISLFRQLEKLGYGQYIAGRHGHPSRFIWKVSIVSVGQAAAGESQNVEAISSEEQKQNDDGVGIIPHVYQLRPELQVTLELPSDLSSREAERLSEFLKTLPFNV